MSLFLKRLLVHIWMVSSSGMLVKSESMSKLPIRLLESCSTPTLLVFPLFVITVLRVRRDLRLL